jgi:3-oxoacyl-[acyl-carrier protein] reductase
MVVMNFDSKVALVTGACGGIGFATAKAFNEAGAHVIITDIFAKESDIVKIALSKLNNTTYFKLDVSNFEEVSNVAKEVLDKFGKIDILINNAGITKDKTIKKISYQEWEDVIKVDLTGVFNVTKAFVESMIERKSGVIINISSIVGLDGNIGQVNYSAAKGGVAALTYTLGKELAKYGIRVVAVAPGFIRTKMVDAIPDEIKRKILSSVPMQRFGEPDEVANVIRFIASDEASYITGTVIRIDGGTHL